VTSHRKRVSNRKNAKRSTGPKTPEGKLRASRNALAHGLSIPISYSQSLTQERQDLARHFQETSRLTPEGALELASSLIAMRRIRQAEGRILTSTFRNTWLLDGAEGLPHALKMLMALKRYRREAGAQFRRIHAYLTNKVG
jgi:hypothetical protein